MAEEKNEQRLAVLIDADNVSSAHLRSVMEEVARYGQPTIKRIYADWTSPNTKNWKEELLKNAIIPVQQYSYTTGKNSTDSAMIIDAMDILYTGQVDGFCIVSSDSDFTRLVMRLRESGVKVIGLGEKKTPEPFIVACDRFIFLEILHDHDNKKALQKNGNSAQRNRNQTPKDIINLIVSSVNDVADEDGWAFLGDVGNLLLRKNPSFDSRNYGFSKLTLLIQSLNLFDIDTRDTSNRGIKHIYIRDKNFVGVKK